MKPHTSQRKRSHSSDSSRKRQRPPTSTKQRNGTSSNSKERATKRTKRTGVHTQSKVNLLKKDSEFLCRMKFGNKLPDIPFDPKLLKYPFDPSRFTRYSTTSLEINYQHVLLTEPDLGISIDLIDPSTYDIPKNPTPLHPKDARLVAFKDQKEATQKPVRRSSMMERPAVSWLRKQTEYLSSDFESTYGSKKKSKDGTMEGRVGIVAEKRALEAGTLHRTRAEVVRLIENTFEVAQRVPVHKTNKSLKPVEIIPVFPDFELWSNQYAQVVFDADPIPQDLSPDQPDYQQRLDELQWKMSQAAVKGFSANMGNTKIPFVAYMTPREKPVDKTQAQEEDEDDDDDDDFAELFGDSEESEGSENKKETVGENTHSQELAEQEIKETQEVPSADKQSIDTMQIDEDRASKGGETEKEQGAVIEEERESAEKGKQREEEKEKEKESESEMDVEQSDKADKQEKQSNGVAYDWIREYTYRADTNNSYFFVWSKDGVYYNEVNSKTLLNKIKSKDAKKSIQEFGRPGTVWRVDRDFVEKENFDRLDRLETLTPLV